VVSRFHPAGQTAEDLIASIMTNWIRYFGPMKVLVADGEKGLASEEVAQFLDRVLVQLKTKAPGEHAQMVERHHELLRRIILRVESQLRAEGLIVPMEVILAESILAKNVLTTVAGQTPYRALYGREPPGLTEFEPQSETVLDDHSGGVAGHSRNHHRVREMAIAAMVQESAQLRIERALDSKTRLAVEQLELEPGDLVDFWRKPATKDESGWRGPARVVEPGDRGGDESSATTVQWQGRMLQVRTQDLRRALVYCALMAFPTAEAQDPRDLMVSFAEGLQRGQLVRIGWVRIDMSQSKARHSSSSGTSGASALTRPLKDGWLRARSSSQHSELLLATLQVAATSFSLAGCIGARIGHGVSALEGIVECDHTFIWWWHVGRPKACWFYQPTGAGRISLAEVFGKDQWSTCAFVQFIMTSDDEVDKIRAAEPRVPNIGGLDGPDRPPPRAPDSGVEAPVPDTPMRSSSSRGSPSTRETWTDGDESVTRPESEADTPSSRRSRSTRRGRFSSAPAPTQRPKRSRPTSLTSRGAVNRRKAEATKASGSSELTPGLPEQGSEHDPTARSSHEPQLPIAEPWQPPDSWGPWPQGPNDPNQGWDPGDEDQPPGLEDDDDPATIDYRSAAEESDDDDEPDEHTFLGELITHEEFLQCIEGGTASLHAYLNEHGTQVEHAPIEALDVQNGANECWSSTEPDMYHLRASGSSELTEPVEVQLSPQMSWLLTPTDGETLPELRHADEYYVVRVYPSGVKRTVVEREQNIISREEALKHEKECNQAMLDELKRWLNLGAFERVSKKHAGNVIDARWVLKWKVVNSERIIQARLVVRGFKDLQAAQLSTFAGTTTRWGQRLVNSVAAQHGWPLFTADVSQAFLRGLTFDQAAQLKDEVHRDVQFTVPPGSVNILKRLPGYQDFNPLTEVLRMLRCGFGVKICPTPVE